MKQLNLCVDNECKICLAGLRRITVLERTKGCYMNRDKAGNKIRGIILIPDFNGAGVLTHWHVQTETKAMAAALDEIKNKPKTNK